MGWRTTPQADEDLADIAFNGIQTFGPTQSRRYVARVIDVFETLAAHPELAPQRQATRQVIRLMPCEAHHILYVIDGDDIIILRVLHHLQDWFDLL